MNKLIYNLLILGALLISTEYKAQHLLEALDAPIFSSTQTRSFSKDFTRNNCSDGGKAVGVFTYTQSATATSTSYISQEDADKKASDLAYNNAVNLVNSNGQNQANSNSKCLWSITASDVTSRTYPGYNMAGTNYGDVTITATSYYTAVSDKSLQDADYKARNGAKKMNTDYLNSSTATIGLAFSKPAYLCYDEYEEEYITGHGYHGLLCPTARRSTGTGMTRESTSNFTLGWSTNGATGGLCTLKAVNWQDPTETKTIFQTLARYKRTVCSNNTPPQSRHHSVVVGISGEPYNP